MPPKKRAAASPARAKSPKPSPKSSPSKRATTPKKTPSKSSTIGSFIKDQAATQLTGANHTKDKAPPFTPLQRLLMALSSLLYLWCAFTFHHFGCWKLFACFCVTSSLSVSADSLTDVVPERVMVPLRVLDRSIGTISLLSSVIVNSNSMTNTILSLAAVLSSLRFLAKGRSVAKSQPKARWTYLAYHGMWHAYGAAVLVGVTYIAQGGYVLKTANAANGILHVVTRDGTYERLMYTINVNQYLPPGFIEGFGASFKNWVWVGVGFGVTIAYEMMK